jgi:hypothetical protein
LNLNVDSKDCFSNICFESDNVGMIGMLSVDPALQTGGGSLFFGGK